MKVPCGGCLRSVQRATRWFATASAATVATPARTAVVPVERVFDVENGAMVVLCGRRISGPSIAGPYQEARKALGGSVSTLRTLCCTAAWRLDIGRAAPAG